MGAKGCHACPAFLRGSGGGGGALSKSVTRDSSVTQASKAHVHVTFRKVKFPEVKCPLRICKISPTFCFSFSH